MKKLTLFKTLLIAIGLLATGLTTNLCAMQSLGRVDMVYDFNGTEHTYAYYKSDNADNPVLDLKDLTTGTFTIKKLYWHCYDDWNTNRIDAFAWYNIGNGDTKIAEYLNYYGSNNDTNGSSDHQISNESVSYLVATANTGNSGTFTFSHWFIANFNGNSDNFEYVSNSTKNYNFTFNILPPNATAITATPSGHISGSGTSDDPYIIPSGGDFSISLSGSDKGREDDNSDVQYSVDGGSTWGTTSEYTSKTFSNVTATSLQNYVFKARCHNSTDNLNSPTVTTETVYYQTATWCIAGSMNSWNTDNQPIAHYSSGTGYVDLNLNANTAYTFKVKDRREDADHGWYGYDTALGYSDSGNGKTFSSSGGNCTINTAGAGTYRFTWNGTSTLTVTYPTSYTVTFGYGTHGTSVTASGSGSGDITSGQYVKTGEDVTFTETHDTGYKLKGWYTASSGGTAVSTMDAGDDVLNGIAANANVYAQYEGNDFTVTFNANYPGTVTNDEEMEDQDFEYGTAQNLTANAFACEGYTFTGWKIDNAGDVISGGSDGSTLTTEDGETVTLYAQWSDTYKYYYKGASTNGWGTAANWTRNAVPGSTDDVIVLTALNAPSGTTTVNSVRIATSGDYTPVGGSKISANGSLTIPGSAALKVVTNIQNCAIEDNAPGSTSSTTSSTLEIAAGGALVWGGGGSPGAARVGFSTVSGGTPGSKEAINEYFGIPFTSLNSDSYYNAWIFQVSGETWAEVSGATLQPWTGYNIIEKLEEGDLAGGSYMLSGTLVSSSASLGSGATAGSETLYANSWVAPIKISKISPNDGTATIYMFTPSSLKDLEDAGLVGDPQGNYSTITINQSAGSYINPMKSFSVWSGTSISISYATAVYGEVGGAFSAPRRERTTDYRQAIWDTQDSLFVYVKTASGWGDELKMFIHNDFSQNYENGWDGPKMEGMWEAPKLYTLNNEGEMAVSCVPSVDNNVIAFHAGTASNEYTFTFKYSGEDELILKDTKTGIETPIVDGGTYEFTSNKGDDDMRFVIKKVPAVVTGVDEISGNNSGVQKFIHNGTMYIVRDGRIYSVEGALVK